jgi:hypothetical protein
MYSAEQIRNKVYIPDPAEGPFGVKEIELKIMLSDYRGQFHIMVKSEEVNHTTPAWLRTKGYNVESVEFLGTKFWQISW